MLRDDSDMKSEKKYDCACRSGHNLVVRTNLSRRLEHKSLGLVTLPADARTDRVSAISLLFTYLLALGRSGGTPSHCRPLSSTLFALNWGIPPSPRNLWNHRLSANLSAKSSWSNGLDGKILGAKDLALFPVKFAHALAVPLMGGRARGRQGRMSRHCRIQRRRVGVARVARHGVAAGDGLKEGIPKDSL